MEAPTHPAMSDRAADAIADVVLFDAKARGQLVAGDPSQLDRIEQQLGQLLEIVLPLAELVRDAGPMLDQLGQMGEQLAKGGLLSLLRPGK